MEPGVILIACIVGLILSPVLALILWALYLLTEGVEGIGRRLYAMLLLLLSAVPVGIVFVVAIALCWAAIGMGLLAVAAVAGIPLGVLGAIVMVAARAAHASHFGQSFQASEPRPSWFTAYLEWIKRVAQGRKAQPQGTKGSGID